MLRWRDGRRVHQLPTVAIGARVMVTCNINLKNCVVNGIMATVVGIHMSPATPDLVHRVTIKLDAIEGRAALTYQVCLRLAGLDPYRKQSSGFTCGNTTVQPCPPSTALQFPCNFNGLFSML